MIRKDAIASLLESHQELLEFVRSRCKEMFAETMEHVETEAIIVRAKQTRLRVIRELQPYR